MKNLFILFLLTAKLSFSFGQDRIEVYKNDEQITSENTITVTQNDIIAIKVYTSPILKTDTLIIMGCNVLEKVRISAAANQNMTQEQSNPNKAKKTKLKNANSVTSEIAKNYENFKLRLNDNDNCDGVSFYLKFPFNSRLSKLNSILDKYAFLYMNK